MRANTGIFATETQALSAIVDRIVLEIDPVEIWLFGSRARGQHRPDSDFDILVVTKAEDGEFGEDYERVYRPVLGLGIGCDILPCPIDDFRRECSRATGIVREIVTEGIKIYGQS